MERSRLARAVSGEDPQGVYCRVEERFLKWLITTNRLVRLQPLQP